MSFDDWFSHLTGHGAPRPWQRYLADEHRFRSRLIRIPTGLGKTEGVLSAWSYHRSLQKDKDWPRRLVWCLPMRVLVEQTKSVAELLAKKIPAESRPSVYLAMGGEDAGDWYLHPEEDAIVIGTQDMLLSKSLNRGYATPRARWPMEFGLLNQDTLWVMDEVQLMDVGLATSAQIQAYREEDAVKSLRPCGTWWMSATLQPDWLQSVDTLSHQSSWAEDPCMVRSADRKGGPWEVEKTIEKIDIEKNDHKAFARRVWQEHSSLKASPNGRITLVVCNTVERACTTFDELRTLEPRQEMHLVHSRFRPHERQQWSFLSRAQCGPDANRIMVATQVVEAGVDISAGCLITELAPWPSLVQRFGRCARYEGFGKVIVVDRGSYKASADPYKEEELRSAWASLDELLNGVGIKEIETYEESLTSEQKAKLYPYQPAHLLLRRELDELFDTTPDLTGADIDISRFIRTGEERDLQVFWAEIAKDQKGKPLNKPAESRKPQRRELCSVSFLTARDWLCEKGKKLKTSKRAWVWDWLDGEWKLATADDLLPGRIVCVASDSGGYRIDRGFDPGSSANVSDLESQERHSRNEIQNEADDQEESELLSLKDSWKTIAWHTSEVASEVQLMTRALGLPEKVRNILELAVIFHDWGKAHLAFQGSIRGNGAISRPNRNDLAKAPKKCWPKRYLYHYYESDEKRPAFRHELASALGLFALLTNYAPEHPALLGPWKEVLEQLNKPFPSSLPVPDSRLIKRVLNCSAEEFDLLVYLVVSHHGKVRVALHASPKDQDYVDRDGNGLPIRGIREKDRLPSVVLFPGESALPEVSLTLSPASLGLSERTGISWRERCIGLGERLGPASLAFVEAILMAADRRASGIESEDPALSEEAKS